jgi:hypothetical protein
MKNKNAEILTENTMFIILNLVFFAILAAFIFIKADDPALMEEAYAKKIALVLDAARPGMQISLDMQKAIDAKDNDYLGKIVSVNGSLVTVNLRNKGGYSYSFFNDISLNKTFFYSSDGGEYLFRVEGYNK